MQSSNNKETNCIIKQQQTGKNDSLDDKINIQAELEDMNFELDSDSLRQAFQGEQSQAVPYVGNNQFEVQAQQEESGQPTFGEIQSCINLLASVDPEMFSPQAINLFYERLFNKLGPKPLKLPANGLRNHSKSQASYNSQMKFENRTNIGFSVAKNMSNFTQNNHHKNLTKTTLAKLEKEKKMERRIIVNAFCNGEGLSGAEAEMKRVNPNHQITKTVYDATIADIALSTYQNLQKLTGKTSKRIDTRGRSTIIRVFTNYRRFLSPKNCQSLFKVMRDLCNGIFKITNEEAHELLKVINNARARVSQKPLRGPIAQQKVQQNSGDGDATATNKNNKFALHRQWNVEYQQKMIEMYRDGAQLAQIRDYFKQLYPQKQQLFEVVPMRSMLFKLVRVGLRKLSRQVFHSGRTDLPTLVKLEDQLVKNIVNCVECFQMRRMILELYTQQGSPKDLMCKIINAINYYNDCGGGLKKCEALSMGRQTERRFQ